MTLSSSDSHVVVPPTITVAADADNATFTTAVAAVYQPQTAVLTIASKSGSQTVGIKLIPPVPSSLTCASGSMTGVGTDMCTVTLTAGAPSGGLTVSLASNNVNVPVPSALMVAAGASSVTFPATAAAVTQPQVATLTITTKNSAQSYTINLIPPAPSSLSCASGSLTGAATDACTVMLTGAAPSSGLTVNLVSNNSNLMVPATVTVAGGSMTAGFEANAMAVTTAQNGIITAAADGLSASIALQLNPEVAILSVNSSAIAFGNVDISSPATQSFVLTSSGTAPVSISAVNVAGAGFSVSGASFPLTLNPNQAAILWVTFDPNSAGAASGAVAVTSNCSMGAMTVSLSGTGVEPSHSVELSWDPPASSPDPVASYNVYRAVSSGSWQLLSTSISVASYMDNTVQNGTAYSYYVTSVDAAGKESVPSNTYVVTIP